MQLPPLHLLGINAPTPTVPSVLSHTFTSANENDMRSALRLCLTSKEMVSDDRDACYQTYARYLLDGGYKNGIVEEFLKKRDSEQALSDTSLAKLRSFVDRTLRTEESVLASNNWKVVQDIDLQTSKAFALQVLRRCQDGRIFDILKTMPEHFRQDKAIVLAAVKRNGIALSIASKNLTRDKKIVLTAVEKSGMALFYASENLKKDKKIVLAAVRESGSALTFADKALKDDLDVVLAAVRQEARAAQWASARLKENRDVALAAAGGDGLLALIYLPMFRSDKDVVLKAVQQSGEALRVASQKLRDDKDVVLEAVKQDGGALEYAGYLLKNDKDVVLAAVRQNVWAAYDAREDVQ